ncbi:hypothetical protein D3C85_1605050 [compost metagenome]
MGLTMDLPMINQAVQMIRMHKLVVRPQVLVILASMPLDPMMLKQPALLPVKEQLGN